MNKKKTLGLLWKEWKNYLKNKGVPSPDIDVNFIISHHLRMKPYEIALKKDRHIPIWERLLIDRSIRERGKFKPVAYILGYKYFYRDKFLVNKKTLIPRADTEHLLYAAEEAEYPFKNILEIGTGSGAIAVSLSRLFPAACITALDMETSIAGKNIKRLKIKNIRLLKEDFFKYPDRMKKKDSEDKNLKGNNPLYDLIISNPPYLSKLDLKNLGRDALLYEPMRAFYGGEDGLDFYRGIAGFALDFLIKEGFIIVETDYKWEKAVGIFKDAGFSKISVKKDYNGLERVITIKKDF